MPHLSLADASTPADVRHNPYTEMPRKIREDTLLTRAQSPYVATSDVTIYSGATLTIEAGVEIQMPLYADIFVRGALIVDGTTEHPVLLRATPSGRSAHRWGGIYFDDSSRPSRLSNLTIERASTEGRYRAGIYAIKSNLTIENLRAENHAGAFLFLQDSEFTIRHCLLSLARGWPGELIRAEDGYGVVEECELYGNSHSSNDIIDFNRVHHGVIRNNLIYGSQGDNSDGIDIDDSLNLLVEGNTIFNCKDKGISISERATVMLVRNLIRGCHIGISVQNGSAVYVDRNTLVSNNVGIAAFRKEVTDQGATAQVVNSILWSSARDTYRVDRHSDISFSYSLANTTILTGTGNLTVDPQFVNAEAGDYRLQFCSPLVNAGDPSSPLDPDQSRADIGAYYVDIGGDATIVINEILYHPTATVSAGVADPMEFIELYNATNNIVDLSRYYFTTDINFTFPDGTHIAPGEYIVLTNHRPAIDAYPYQTFEWSGNNLSDQGGELRFLDRCQREVDYVYYHSQPPWPPEPSINGSSLMLLSPAVNNSLAENWRSSREPGGTPGQSNWPPILYLPLVKQ